MIYKNIDYWIKSVIDACEDVVDSYWKSYDNWVDFNFIDGPQFLVHRIPEHWSSSEILISELMPLHPRHGYTKKTLPKM